MGKRGRLRPRGTDKTAPVFSVGLDIPAEEDEIEWAALLRANMPLYVAEQIRRATFHLRCTQVSLLLTGIANLRDSDGRSLVHVRKADLVPDRRKCKRPPLMGYRTNSDGN